MSIEIIKKELADFPAIYGSLSDFDAATLLNVVDKQQNIDVSIAELESYLFREGVYDALKAKGLGNGGTASDTASKTLINIFTSNIETVDVSHAKFQEGLTALIDNDLTQAQADAITAMGIKTISRATELGIPEVHEGHIIRARNPS